MRSLAVACALVTSLVGREAFADPVRYFGVWSYAENAPMEEIDPDRLATRKLGYWALEFNSDGSVKRGTFHGSNGTVWLSFRYVVQLLEGELPL